MSEVVSDKDWPQFLAVFFIQNLAPLLNRGGDSYSVEEMMGESIDLAALLFHGRITTAKAREILRRWQDTGESIRKQLEGGQALKFNNVETFEICVSIAYRNKDILKQCALGNRKKLGSIVGQIIKAGQNRCDPEFVNQCLNVIIDYYEVIDWSNQEEVELFLLGIHYEQ